MEFTLPSFAKINLDLRVLGKRPDGFHEIFTIFQTISLCDLITFESGSDEIELECDDVSLPTDSRNLIVRAAEQMRRSFEVQKGARIRLRKRIPAGGGLGGGSSNAAVALFGLDRLWGLGVPSHELEAIARRLGSDVPFFLYGGTMAGTGTGTDLEETPARIGGNLLLVDPGTSVSSAAAYSSAKAQNLTKGEANRILRVCRSGANSPEFLSTTLRNDLEAAVFPAFPEVRRAKAALIELGASRALMSGSGSSVFGVFEKEETRQAAMKALDDEVNWRKFAVAAVSRDEYREKMFEAIRAV